MFFDFFTSKVPGLFDRNFATSYLLPATFFGLATFYFVSLGFRVAFISYSLSPSLDQQVQIISIHNREDLTLLLGIFAFFSVLLAILLLLLNKVFILLMEGHWPPVSWFRRYAQSKYTILQEKLSIITEKMRATREMLDEDHRLYRSDWKEVRDQYALVLDQLKDYPKSERLILPTLFGNIIRSAEYYAWEQYGADPSILQTRLWYVVDEKFKAASDSAKAKVDFAVNSFFLAALLLIEILVLVLFAPNGNALLFGSWYFFPILLLLMLAAYQMAITQAREWAEYIRSANDLFLRQLIEKMGFPLPKTLEEQREFWRSASQWLIYGSPMDLSFRSSPSSDSGKK